MRSILLVAVLSLVGCSKRHPTDVLPVEDSPDTTTAQPVEVAPMPWEVPTDQRTADRFRSYQTCDTGFLAALARREIRAGDDIEPLFARYPECRIYRHGLWIDLSFSRGFGGTSIIAKNGKLVRGATGSCTYCDEFFNTTTNEEWTDHTHSYYERLDRWVAFRGSMPALIGAPSLLMVSWRPNDR
jgi:hypothetical protein